MNRYNDFILHLINEQKFAIGYNGKLSRIGIPKSGMFRHMTCSFISECNTYLILIYFNPAIYASSSFVGAVYANDLFVFRMMI